MRASLFATATATTFAVFFSNSPTTHEYLHRKFLVIFTMAVLPTTKGSRRYWSPCFVMRLSLTLPPVEFGLGTRPIHAARSRPDLNWLGSVTYATSACTIARRRDRFFLVRPGHHGVFIKIQLIVIRFDLYPAIRHAKARRAR